MYDTVCVLDEFYNLLIASSVLNFLSAASWLYEIFGQDNL